MSKPHFYSLVYPVLLLFVLVAYRLSGQPTPTPPEASAFQKGETISVQEDLEISTTTTLDVGGASISHTPAVADAHFSVQQLIQVVDVGAAGTTVNTQGPVVQNQDAATSPPTTYKFVCNAGMHFDDSNFVTTQMDTAVLQETCELLERITQTGSLLAGVKNGIITTDLATTHVLMPVTYEAPAGSWVLSYKKPVDSSDTFTVNISNAVSPFTAWSGTITSNASSDDMSVGLSATGVVQSPAPSGGTVNATVSQVLKYHRVVQRALPPSQPPAAAGAQGASL